MAQRKVIAVVGATGAQGGGLVRAILAEAQREFAVRALTRNPHSEKARALAAQGVEVVAADLDDESSLERAFDGAHGAFCVTSFWEHLSPEKEIAQAANMARAAKAAGLAHVIWSTLEDTRQWVPLEDDRMPTLHGRYKVPHFDGKGEADGIFTELGLPVTFLLTSFYFENFIQLGAGPQPGPDGVLAITFPLGRARLPGIAVDDIGRCALGIFRRPEEYVGRRVGIAGDCLTGEEMAATFTRHLGRPVRYNDIPAEIYRSLPFPGAADLGNMFQVIRDFNEAFCAARSPELARRLYPSLETFDGWLARNHHRIPLA
jgi:uncharacterized protein YbjT (DUF2867 family)